MKVKFIAGSCLVEREAMKPIDKKRSYFHAHSGGWGQGLENPAGG
jgi:hypothetical protein